MHADSALGRSSHRVSVCRRVLRTILTIRTIRTILILLCYGREAQFFLDKLSFPATGNETTEQDDNQAGLKLRIAICAVENELLKAGAFESELKFIVAQPLLVHDVILQTCRRT